MRIGCFTIIGVAVAALLCATADAKKTYTFAQTSDASNVSSAKHDANLPAPRKRKLKSPKV